MKSALLALLGLSSVIAQTAPQLCSQIDKFNACMMTSRQAVDTCSNSVNGVPDVGFYDCQCKALTSQTACFPICSDSPDIQLQLPAVQANAKSWCDQAESMHTTTSPSTTSTTPATSSTSTSSASVTTKTSTVATTTKSVGGSSTSTGTLSSYGPTSTLDFSSSSTTTITPWGAWYIVFPFLYFVL